MWRSFVKQILSASIVLICLSSSAQVIRGYTGTQVFANCGEPDPGLQICNVDVGAGYWLSFVPTEAGVLYLNTDGSTFDTALAVFIRSPSNPTQLQVVACDNNSGTDGRDSATHLNVRAGETNFILIAGVDGACGTVTFAYSLLTRSRLAPLARTPTGKFQARVTGHTNMKFMVEASSNLVSWAPLLTTNSSNATCDFVDPTTPTPPRRFYRAQMLP